VADAVARTGLERLLAARGYDSNGARVLLAKRAIEPIIPRQRNNTVAPPQDGRKLRRDRPRWSVAGTNSWLQNFRRLGVRDEYKVKIFEAPVQLACAVVTLKRVSG
jgi:hypothetical protein